MKPLVLSHVLSTDLAVVQLTPGHVSPPEDTIYTQIVTVNLTFQNK